MQPVPIASWSERHSRRHPLLELPAENLDFVVQFVLSSGSLKDMAHLYGVSYPTIRLALDRVIANLQQSLSGEPPDAVTELLAKLVERGEIEAGTARSIREAHRSAVERIMTKEDLK